MWESLDHVFSCVGSTQPACHPINANTAPDNTQIRNMTTTDRRHSSHNAFALAAISNFALFIFLIFFLSFFFINSVFTAAEADSVAVAVFSFFVVWWSPPDTHTVSQWLYQYQSLTTAPMTCRRHTLDLNLYEKLVQETSTVCVSQSATSFFLVQVSCTL